jgi:hypothetical protein
MQPHEVLVLGVFLQCQQVFLLELLVAECGQACCELLALAGLREEIKRGLL